MPNPAGSGRNTSQLLALVSGIPTGYVCTHGALGRRSALQPRHVAHVLAPLGDADRAICPWWRVVADGGAIGRHVLRDEQIARLAGDGVPLSAAGIVQELAARRIDDLDAPPTSPFASPAAGAEAARSRSRGMKSHPAG